jgi:hypothetical protein
MTATATSILARNSFEPLLPTADQMEFVRDKLMRDIINSMALPKEMLEGHAHKVEAPSTGWMPAGTYMPTKDGPRMTSQEHVKAHELISRATKHLLFRPCPTEWRPDERGAGIAKRIPAYERRFSSRVTTWDPMDDTFLEDA